jgi:hypothetical protein
MSNYKVPQLGSFEWQQAVKDKDLSTPVGLTPAKGDRYIVKATGSGDWTGHNNAIATYNGATWDFVEAVEGLVCYIKDEDLVYIYTTSWIIWVGACTYLKTFTNGDLSTGKLTVTHNLNSTYPIVVVYDNNEKEIIPDDITYQSVNALEIDLTLYGSLTGTWHARVFGSTPVEIKQTEIKDADGDTKVETEKNADEDKVRITTGGTERALIDSNGLKLASGADVNEFSTDGTLAGNSDDAIPTEKAVKTYFDNVINGTTCRAYLSGNQTITAGGGYEKIAFNAESFDTLAEFDSTTNRRFTAINTGVYLVNVTVFCSTENNLFWYCCKNGNTSSGTILFGSQRPTTGGAVPSSASDIVQLTASDYLEVWTECDNVNGTILGGTYMTWISIKRVG